MPPGRQYNEEITLKIVATDTDGVPVLEVLLVTHIVLYNVYKTY